MSGDRHIDPTREALAGFRDLPANTPIEMLNLVQFRDRARYADDHPDASRGRTGEEAYRAYSAASGPVFASVGGRIIWSADPQLVLIGPESERWDAAFVARYPDANAFLAMLAAPAYKEAVKHRQAAVATSRLVRMSPRS